MGLGAFTLTQLLIVLVIIVLLFGTKKLGNIGEDLGKAFKGFKKAVNDEQDSQKSLDTPPPPPIDSTAQVVRKEDVK